MDNDGRRIADREARDFRNSLEYIKGYEAGITKDSEISPKYLTRIRWVWAINRVRSKLKVYAPKKEEFFSEYYGLDKPPCIKLRRDSMIHLSMKLFVGEATLYKWKEQILDELVLAATQAGVYHPF